MWCKVFSSVQHSPIQSMLISYAIFCSFPIPCINRYSCVCISSAYQRCICVSGWMSPCHAWHVSYILPKLSFVVRRKTSNFGTKYWKHFCFVNKYSIWFQLSKSWESNIMTSCFKCSLLYIIVHAF